jgi:hypothetical protein
MQTETESPSHVGSSALVRRLVLSMLCSVSVAVCANNSNSVVRVYGFHNRAICIYEFSIPRAFQFNYSLWKTDMVNSASANGFDPLDVYRFLEGIGSWPQPVSPRLPSDWKQNR